MEPALLPVSIAVGKNKVIDPISTIKRDLVLRIRHNSHKTYQVSSGVGLTLSRLLGGGNEQSDLSITIFHHY